MTATQADIALIEQAGGQRADRFSFRVLNPDRSPLDDDLKVHADSVPQIQVDTSRTTFRTCSGAVILDPPVGLDTFRARIQPVVTLSNGAEFELGVLMFGGLGENVFATGAEWAPELYDESFLLQQNLDRTWTLEPGGSVLAMFAAMAGEILDPLGVPHSYEVGDTTTATPLVYKVGTARILALNALAALLGALPPFFTNRGVHRLKPAPRADRPDHLYEIGTRIVDATTTLSSSRYKAPNRYIVVGDDVGGAAVRGVYDLPAAAPNSEAKTGRVVTAPTHTASGVKDPDLAAQIAYVDAVTDRTTYATARFAANCDPRHEVFDAVDLFGTPYLEQGWTLSCESGGEHQHQLTRIYG